MVGPGTCHRLSSEYSGNRCLQMLFVREQYHWLLLVMDMDDQPPEQPRKEGQSVLSLANGHLLNPRCSRLQFLLTSKHIIHKMQDPALAPSRVRYRPTHREHLVQFHILPGARPDQVVILEAGHGQHWLPIECGMIEAIEQMEPARSRRREADPAVYLA